MENYGLMPFDFQKGYLTLTYCNLMTHVKHAIGTEQKELEHTTKGLSLQNLSESYELKVNAKTLTEILDQHNIERIDFFSLDVEGYELSVLKGLDLERYSPTFIVLETWENNADNQEKYLSPYYEPIAQLSYHDVIDKHKNSF